jgi:hypothetical protein
MLSTGRPPQCPHPQVLGPGSPGTAALPQLPGGGEGLLPRFSGALRYTVPWLHAELEETEAVLGEDPWPYGLEPNRKTLETLLRYLVEQGFVDRARPVEEFFAPVTVVNE